MSMEVIEKAVEIAGKTYYLKCQKDESDRLIRAAEYLNAQLRTTREKSQIISFDKLIVITALNIVYDLILHKDQYEQEMQQVNQHVHAIENKIEQALMQDAQLELSAN